MAVICRFAGFRYSYRLFRITHIILLHRLAHGNDVECISCFCNVFYGTIFENDIDLVVAAAVGVVYKLSLDHKVSAFIVIQSEFSFHSLSYPAYLLFRKRLFLDFYFKKVSVYDGLAKSTEYFVRMRTPHLD